MWTIIGADGQVIPVIAPLIDGSKDEIAMVVKRLVRNHDGIRIGFMAESWVGKNPNIQPRDDPERREVVFFLVEDKDGGCLSAHIEIKRDVVGNGILQPLEYTPSDAKQSGRFADYFSRTIN